MRDKYQNLDLNLLRVLVVLAETSSATLAAQRLGISQPAVSRLLARLRDHFDEPLLVKDGSGLSATPLAQHLAGQLAPILQAIEQVIGDVMRDRHHEQLDLNLLRVLVALAHERNTYRAAKRLYLSQPAVSRALGRLRAHFDDALFVKQGRGLVPNPLAGQLVPRIAPLLSSLANVVNQGVEFAPGQQQGLLRLAMPPGLLGALGARIYLALAEQAPGLSVQLDSWSAEVPAQMQSGELLAAINFEHMALPKDLARLPLCELTQSRVYLRHGHPLLTHDVDGQISPEQLRDYPVAITYNVSMQPELQIADMERGMGLPPQSLTIKLVTDHSRIILQLLPGSDLLFLSLMDHRDEPGIGHLALQAPPSPARLQLFTHARNRQSPQLLWLHRLLRAQL